MSDTDEFRMVNLSRAQRNILAADDHTATVSHEIAARWDQAPEDAWAEISDEFKRHRCKDGDCFAESVLIRLGAIRLGRSPFDLPTSDAGGVSR